MSTTPTVTKAVILPSIETPTLTKAELSELLFDNLGLNKRESKDMVLWRLRGHLTTFIIKVNFCIVAQIRFKLSNSMVSGGSNTSLIRGGEKVVNRIV